MPRTFTNKTIYCVWVSGAGGKSKTFTDEARANAYASKEKKYNSNVLTKALTTYNASISWFNEMDVQFARLQTRTVKMDGATPVSVAGYEEGEGEAPRYYELMKSNDPSVCMLYSDCSYTKGSLARLGVWSESLNFTLTEILKPEDNHQSGELKGIFVALMQFVQLGMTSNTKYSRVVCLSDSRWAIDTMNKFVRTWIRNHGETGKWMTAARQPVKHSQVIRGILDLERTVQNRRIEVEYLWIPRHLNAKADEVSRADFVGTKLLHEKPLQSEESMKQEAPAKQEEEEDEEQHPDPLPVKTES